jgi:hypothetical protein
VQTQHHVNLWEELQAMQSSEEKLKQFDRRSKKYQNATEPSIEKLIHYTNKELRRSGWKYKNKELLQHVVNLAVQEGETRRAVDQQIDSFTTTERYNHVPEAKPTDTIQIMLNSLGVFAKGKARQKKIRQLNHLMKE